MRFLHCADRNDPEIVEKASRMLDVYGVDYIGYETYLGRGAYKEIHRTNIPGVVMVVTSNFTQLEKELAVLDLMNIEGFPAMKYYTMEQIGNTIFALADLLFPPAQSWDRDRLRGVEEKVRGHMIRMLDMGITFSDLQFMVDANDNPVFTDPLDMESLEDYKKYSRYIEFFACCKDDKSSLSVEITRKLRD